MKNPPQTCPAVSPCVDICELDAAEVCIGCGRSLDEIGEWLTASEPEKRQILASARLRLEQRRQTG